MSYGYTNAENPLSANYSVGDVVAFHRSYKRVGVEKGDERLVAGVDHERREVLLDGGRGGTVDRRGKLTPYWSILKAD